MFGAYNTQIMAIPFSHDPAADDDLVCFVAPKQMEVISANFACSNAVAASGTNYFDVALYNGGTAGTATTLLAGTIGGTVGWVAKTPRSFTISNGTVTAGQVVYLGYNEEGTGTFAHGVLTVEYVVGQA